MLEEEARKVKTARPRGPIAVPSERYRLGRLPWHNPRQPTRSGTVLPPQAFLSPEERSKGLPGVGKPKQAQKSDEHNLADDRKAVDEERDAAARHGCLDQIQNSHNDCLKAVCRHPAALSPLVPVSIAA
jgi:hypothetical protein